MGKTIRVGIISGLIGTMIFMYFLDPIIRAFGEGVLYISQYVATGLLDSLYKKCALGVAQDPALSTLSFLTGIVAGLCVGFVSTVFRKNSQEEGEDERRKSTKSIKRLVIILAFIAPIMLTSHLWTMFFQYEVVTSYNQHIKILAPYMSTGQQTLFHSEFASIQTEDDYKKLYLKLNSVAKNNNITLPENPSYRLWNI
jgi:hypothetical protein